MKRFQKIKVDEKKLPSTFIAYKNTDGKGKDHRTHKVNYLHAMHNRRGLSVKTPPMGDWESWKLCGPGLHVCLDPYSTDTFVMSTNACRYFQVKCRKADVIHYSSDKIRLKSIKRVTKELSLKDLSGYSEKEIVANLEATKKRLQNISLTIARLRLRKQAPSTSRQEIRNILRELKKFLYNCRDGSYNFSRPLEINKLQSGQIQLLPRYFYDCVRSCTAMTYSSIIRAKSCMSCKLNRNWYSEIRGAMQSIFYTDGQNTCLQYEVSMFIRSLSDQLINSCYIKHPDTNKVIACVLRLLRKGLLPWGWDTNKNFVLVRFI